MSTPWTQEGRKITEGDKQYKIPEGMWVAALDQFCDFWTAQHPSWNASLNKDAITKQIISTVIKWLAENPIAPTGKQIQEISDSLTAKGDHYHSTETYCSEWQRRMFLAPEPVIPEAIKDLIWSESLYHNDVAFCHAIPKVNKTILEAYRRGKEGK